MQIVKGNLFTRLVAAAAVSAVVGLSAVAAHAQQVPVPGGGTTGTTSATGAGANQQMKDDQMKKDKAEKKAKKTKKDKDKPPAQ